jgi:hypothetical protein
MTDVIINGKTATIPNGKAIIINGKTPKDTKSPRICPFCDTVGESPTTDICAACMKFNADMFWMVMDGGIAPSIPAAPAICPIVKRSMFASTVVR